MKTGEKDVGYQRGGTRVSSIKKYDHHLCLFRRRRGGEKKDDNVENAMVEGF